MKNNAIILNGVNYDLYLFSCLLKIYDEQFEKRPYDEQYDVLPALYDEFNRSTYNDNNTNLYECIELFLKNKYENR